MSVGTSTIPAQRHSVRANGIDIHYVEQGVGQPLLLLHGGSVSTGDLWAGHPGAYVSHMDSFAQHFRVIAPDLRGYGRTVGPGGAISYAQLADDALALIDVLGLDRPLIAGNSDGGHIALTIGIRNPGAIRAIVNHAGYSLFDPANPSWAMMREVLGGSPDATEAHPDAVARFFDVSDEARATFELFKADNDGLQEPDYWQRQVAEMYGRLTQHTSYTLEDFDRIEVPTLILAGDRDDFHPVETAVVAYRNLRHGELAVIPNLGHGITPEAVDITIEFLERYSA